LGINVLASHSLFQPCAETHFGAQYGWSRLLKILAVSDVVVDRLYSSQTPEYFRGVGMVLGCGDLPYEYLEYLVSMLNVPLLYVPGNHDPQFNEKKPSCRAEGCENIDQRVTQVKGLNLAGLGGSIRYRPGSPNQYTQAQMYLRVISLIPKLLRQRLKTGRPLDIMVTHSPLRGVNEGGDAAHAGFSALRDLVRFFRPRYFLHGHTLFYKGNLVAPQTRVESTTVCNVYPYRLIEVDAHAG
jgi:uncharacterized protein